jgi:hypothetical protein
MANSPHSWVCVLNDEVVAGATALSAVYLTF